MACAAEDAESKDIVYEMSRDRFELRTKLGAVSLAKDLPSHMTTAIRTKRSRDANLTVKTVTRGRNKDPYNIRVFYHKRTVQEWMRDHGA
jgi:hypothetical protein